MSTYFRTGQQNEKSLDNHRGFFVFGISLIGENIYYFCTVIFVTKQKTRICVKR